MSDGANSDAPRQVSTSAVRRVDYGFMEKNVAPVNEICPITGDIIDFKPTCMKTIIGRHLAYDRSPAGIMAVIKEQGISASSDEEILEAYNTIKDYDDNNVNFSWKV